MRVSKGISVILISSAVLLGGCSQINELTQMSHQEYEPTKTALEFHENGSVTETIFDTLDQSWYNEGELSDLITSSVAEYNAAAGADAVSAALVEITEGTQVKVVMEYASMTDYAGYNQIDSFEGTILGAQMEGYTFSNSFVKISEGKMGSEVDGSEALSHKEYQVLVTDTSHEVHVPGQIVYVSSNAETVDAYTARASQAEIVIEAEAEDAETDPDLANVYIIYEF